MSRSNVYITVSAGYLTLIAQSIISWRDKLENCRENYGYTSDEASMQVGLWDWTESSQVHDGPKCRWTV